MQGNSKHTDEIQQVGQVTDRMDVLEQGTS